VCPQQQKQIIISRILLNSTSGVGSKKTWEVVFVKRIYVGLAVVVVGLFLMCTGVLAQENGGRIVLTDMGDLDGWVISGKEGVPMEMVQGDGVGILSFTFPGGGAWGGATKEFTVDLDKYPIIEVKFREIDAGDWMTLYIGFSGVSEKNRLEISTSGKSHPFVQVEPDGVFRINVKERFGFSGVRKLPIYIAMYGARERKMVIEHIHALDTTYEANL
jgi:hypothetical protein